MGLHIDLYKIEGIEEYQDHYPYRTIKTFKTSTPSWWDSTRHSGDRGFCNAIDFEQRVDGDDVDPGINTRVYSRPSDLDYAISWVKVNIYKGNQERLLKVLKEMKNDPSLWFCLSY